MSPYTPAPRHNEGPERDRYVHSSETTQRKVDQSEITALRNAAATFMACKKFLVESLFKLYWEATSSLALFGLILQACGLSQFGESFVRRSLACCFTLPASLRIAVLCFYKQFWIYIHSLCYLIIEPLVIDQLHKSRSIKNMIMLQNVSFKFTWKFSILSSSYIKWTYGTKSFIFEKLNITYKFV